MSTDVSEEYVTSILSVEEYSVNPGGEQCSLLLTLFFYREDGGDFFLRNVV
jgi:hypothetical protein